jgi:ABC-type oligopeptide transport system substrate-binding subunit
MSNPTIEEIYDTQIRQRSRAERRRLIEIAERDLDKEAPAPTNEEPTLALFAKWKEEDSKMTADEIEAEKVSWEEFKANINAERDRAGARRVF